MQSETLVYRSAVARDKAAVLSICDNLYNGWDYLPSCYDQFINDVNTTCCLVETRNETVGFCAGLLVDEGQTVVSRAGRVRPLYQNKGIYRQLLNKCLRESTATISAFTVTGPNFMARESLQKSHRHVLSKSSLDMYAKRKELRMPTTREPNLPAMSESDITDLFSSPSAIQSLFPRDRIIINWVPFRPIRANIPLFQSVCTRLDSFSNLNDTLSQGLLTTWSSFIHNETIMVTSDLYGNDMTSFPSHLTSFLTRVEPEPWKALYITACFNPNVSHEIIENMVTMFNIKCRIPLDIGENEFCLLEKHIDI